MTVQDAGNVVAVERIDGACVVTLDDGKVNALGFQLQREAAAAVEEAADRADALVLAGRPGRFSAGFDMSVLLSGPDAAVELMTEGMRLAQGLLSYPRPVVAACTGHAVAGGALLLLCCDLRLGLDGPFKIGFNEVAVGVPLPSFAITLARARLDPRRLVAATLGAQIFTPTEAAQVGFLDRVVEADVVGAAIVAAQRLGRYPADAYRLAKHEAQHELLDRLRAGARQDIDLITALMGRDAPKPH